MNYKLTSLSPLSRAPFKSLITCFLIGMLFALPMAFFIVLKNAEILSKPFQQTTQFMLYLKQNTSTTQALTLVKELQHQSDIATVRAVSPDEGLQELQQKTGLNNMIQALPQNPLPWTIIITTTQFPSLPPAELTNQLKQLRLVETVQTVLPWAKHIISFIALMHQVIYLLAICLGMVVLFIVRAAIRSAALQQSDAHLLIRKPFLSAGILYGLLGGIIAWQLVDLLVWALQNPTQQLASFYNSSFKLAGINFTETVILLGGSVSVGLAGAWFGIGSYKKSKFI